MTSNDYFICYTHSLFNALSQMLCIGYGLRNPYLIGEVIVTIVSMASGSAVYAIAVAFACNALSSVDHPSRLYSNAVETLNEFMRVHCLPKPLRTQLRVHLKSRYPNQRMFSRAEVMGELPLPVRADVQHAQCAGLFARTPIFNDADPSFLAAVAAQLQPMIALPGEWLTREGELQKHVFFIETGLVEVIVDGEAVAELGDGSYLGEISALSRLPTALEDLGEVSSSQNAGFASASVRCKELCHMHLLEQKVFEGILLLFPAVREAMAVVARLRLLRSNTSCDPYVPAVQKAPNPKTINRKVSLYWETMNQLTHNDVAEYAKYQTTNSVPTPRITSSVRHSSGWEKNDAKSKRDSRGDNSSWRTSCQASPPQCVKGIARHVSDFSMGRLRRCSPSTRSMGQSMRSSKACSDASPVSTRREMAPALPSLLSRSTGQSADKSPSCKSNPPDSSSAE